MTKRQPQNQTPAFCNYDNSTYQEDFWGDGKRAYEDAAEAMALARLLPKSGKLMLEIGAAPVGIRSAMRAMSGSSSWIMR